MSTGVESEPLAVPSRFAIDFTGLILLGQFQVDRRLAEGGMATAFLGRDLTLDRPVVVKVPHARYLAEPGFRERFQREVRDLVGLQHPHIVGVLARGEHEEIPFFVLTYLGGGIAGGAAPKARPHEVPGSPRLAPRHRAHAGLRAFAWASSTAT